MSTDRGPRAAEPDQPAETAGPRTDLDPEPPSPEELARFCSTADALAGEKPEAYVGSAEHVADITALRDVAPAEIRTSLEAYRSFLAEGGVDPDDPGSNLTESWPPEIQAAVEAMTDYITTHCWPSHRPQRGPTSHRR
ncbi:MAG TPA: hypothetical protein VEW93_10425 [Acidimicrobiales bacterium]|nr:hypothetical protein [Acidimicrobiales bacterium]